jgi:AbrB family looped-hinge helix DNA binding protein
MVHIYEWDNMAEVISIDKAGRLVIPKSIRKSLGITKDTKFIIAEGDGGKLLLQKLDIDEIVTRLEKEMKGKSVDKVIEKVRKDLNARVKKRYPDIFA